MFLLFITSAHTFLRKPGVAIPDDMHDASVAKINGCKSAMLVNYCLSFCKLKYTGNYLAVYQNIFG